MNTVDRSPTVGVIIRTKDRPEFLLRALHSVYLQSYPGVKAVIINDGGRSLSELLKSERQLPDFKLIEFAQNQGRSAAGNAGLLFCREQQLPYCSFLDDDDQLYPHHFSYLFEEMQESDQIVYADALEATQSRIPGEVKTTYQTNSLLVRHSTEFTKRRLLEGSFLPIQTLLFRTEVFAGRGFDPSYDVLEDWELWLHLALVLELKFRHLRKITSEYSVRTDASNTTGTNEQLWTQTRQRLFQQYRQYGQAEGLEVFPTK